MTALKPFSYELVTTNWRLIAEVLGLGLEEVYQREPRAMSHTQQNALTTILHMEALTRQYGPRRRPVTIPEPQRPLVPDYAEWPAALRPELIQRRMQAVIVQGKAESYYQHARRVHAEAWAGWDEARRELGY
jgi:hypothetical protein